MKFKTTRRDIKANYQNIISINFGKAQNLLTGKQAIAYNSTELWNWDVYEVDPTTCIVTGARPFKGTVETDYDLLDRYEKKARQILKVATKYDFINDECNSLLKAFVYLTLGYDGIEVAYTGGGIYIAYFLTKRGIYTVDSDYYDCISLFNGYSLDIDCYEGEDMLMSHGVEEMTEEEKRIYKRMYKALRTEATWLPVLDL